MSLKYLEACSLQKSRSLEESLKGFCMYRLHKVVRNYGLSLRSWQEGDCPQEAPRAETSEPFVTPRTRQVIEQRISLQIRRRLIKKALEEV